MHSGLIRSARLIGKAEQRVLLLHCAWEVFGQREAYSRDSWTENADKAGLVGLLEDCLREEIADGPEKQTIKRSIQSKLEEMENWFYLGFVFKTPTYKELRQAVKKYFEKLEELGAIDYDLLSRDFLQCLRRYKNLTKEFSSEFDAILVDEFQDTSRIQAEILLLLSGKGRNIWVVGDPCQQIYGWRGAGPENLFWFIKKTGAKRYYLTENWRSTQVILDGAYRFLSSRVSSLKKKGMLKQLKSMRSNGTSHNDEFPILTGTLDRTLFLICQLLDLAPDLKLSNFVILSRKLDKRTVKEIEKKLETKD
jgi:superfamily I DNA/RNA helicase